MKFFGLVGKTLTHSFSRAYFSEKFSRESLSECRYENFELDQISDIKSLVLSHPNLRGLNVTIPYKESVIPYLHLQHEVVQAIGACNCIRIENGKLHGFNTDVTGFRLSLLKGLRPEHKKALVLGTGGAAKAVMYVLKQLNISFKLVSRKQNADSIIYKNLDEEIMNTHSLIINTTPVGMYPHVHDCPPLPYQYIGSEHLLYDLIYNPEETLFLKSGKEKGAAITNGHDMLLIQAEESWRIWNA